MYKIKSLVTHCGTITLESPRLILHSVFEEKAMHPRR